MCEREEGGRERGPYKESNRKGRKKGECVREKGKHTEKAERKEGERGGRTKRVTEKTERRKRKGAQKGRGEASLWPDQ